MTEPETTHSVILARLKAETQAEHDAIERVLDLTSDALTLAAYRERLARLYGFHRPVEARLHAVPGIDLHARRKHPLLLADLHALGGDDPEQLPLCVELPPLAGPADRFGCLYVLEGATLGGRVIARHVARTLGVTPASGGRFFHGYDARTAAMWQAFRGALAAFAEASASHDRIVAAAIATFRTLRVFCEAHGEGRVA